MDCTHEHAWDQHTVLICAASTLTMFLRPLQVKQLSQLDTDALLKRYGSVGGMLSSSHADFAAHLARASQGSLVCRMLQVSIHSDYLPNRLPFSC